MHTSLYLRFLAGAVALEAFAFSFAPTTTINSVRLAKENGPTAYRALRSESTHTLHILNLVEDNADTADDDGWGDEPTQSSSERISKSQELAKLQNDLATKQNRQVSTGSQSSGSDSGERDLFIPIVTLISVMGFTGLYGYEMLRLYSRGELYLPWEQ